MTAREVNAIWRNQMPEGKYDYWTAQEDWTIFVDGLNRDGVITDNQRNRILFPYKYGKPVNIRK